MAPSHYLKQWSLIIADALYNSSEGDFNGNIENIAYLIVFKNEHFKPQPRARGQWIT